jgi:hypothetical protein
MCPCGQDVTKEKPGGSNYEPDNQLHSSVKCYVLLEQLRNYQLTKDSELYIT